MRSSVVNKSVMERIKGKDGRIRGNLMGKRVDFAARSVISPGPTLDVDQVGVPIAIAVAQTVPETVTLQNIESLSKRVTIGANDIKGAECVISNDGTQIQLQQCAKRNRICLALGWVVERYLQNDDVVIFNRQPSLHKMGMMGHRVQLVDGYTFRLNLSVTAPYNADFDGDEMNLHVPQSAAARASVASLMMVTDQMISPQANKPCISIVQDALLGAYRLSMGTELITQDLAGHIIGHAKYVRPSFLPAPCVTLLGVPYWSGKQIFSLLLPPDFWMDTEAPNIQTLEDVTSSTRIVVRNGKLLFGCLNKSILGGSAGGLIDVLYRDYTR
jgi:DNA-directed RNA polymerase II subunit RPB1